jgi:hypothetical protein
MTPVRWTTHALQNLIDREIDRSIAETAVREPEFIVPDPPGRQIYMRRYDDAILNQQMLLRVVVEEENNCLVIVTLYKTSQVERYLKGLIP